MIVVVDWSPRKRIISQSPTRHRGMFRTLSIVVSVGLADSVNASTIGPALFLAGGEHPRWSVFEFILGVVAVFFLGGTLLVLGPGRALFALVPHPSRTARYIVETVVGIVMLVGAVVLWTRRRSLSRKAGEDRRRREAGPQDGDLEPQRPGGEERGSDDGARTQRRRSPALMGAGIAAVELPTAFPYFAAIAKIVSSRIDLGRELLLVAVYDFCFVLPLLGIILVLTVAGDGATQKLARIRAQFEAHWPAVAAAAALIVGVYVTTLGVTGLASGASGRTGRLARRVRHVIAR
jgi:cytochrome c biogenesis protein CcdA